MLRPDGADQVAGEKVESQLHHTVSTEKQKSGRSRFFSRGKWSGRKDLNLRPPAPEADSLRSSKLCVPGSPALGTSTCCPLIFRADGDSTKKKWERKSFCHPLLRWPP
jgi:hypothetical protein